MITPLILQNSFRVSLPPLEPTLTPRHGPRTSAYIPLVATTSVPLQSLVDSTNSPGPRATNLDPHQAAQTPQLKLHSLQE